MKDMLDNSFVWSVQVRSVDPPQFVAEATDDLDGREGEILGLEQCDRCGNVAYVLTKGERGRWTVVCTEDPDDEISHQFGGCGAVYPLHLEKAKLVAF